MAGLLTMSLDELMGEARRAAIQAKKKVEAVADKAGGTEWEMKLKSATSLDNWNTSSTKLNVLAQGTYDSGIYREIVPLLWQRMSEKPKYWRIVFKCLNVTEYFIRHGSQRFIEEAKEKQYQIKLLQNFHYVDSEEKDRGAAIRQKAKELCELLDDDMRIRQLRQEAVKNADKFQALSSNGSSVTSSSTGAYGAGGYDTGSSNARYGGYEGESNYDSGEHPTVDYSDTGSTPKDTHTTTAKSRRKKEPVIAGSAHSPHAAAVNDAFDSNFDDFERDLQQATANSLADIKPSPKVSAQTKTVTPTNGGGDFSDHEGSDALPTKVKKKKSKKAVANKAIVAFGDNGLMAPPGSSSSTSKSSSKQKDLLSLEDEFGSLNTSSSTPASATNTKQPSSAKPKAVSDDFLSFDAQTAAATSSSTSNSTSLFDQLASRGTTTASATTAKSPAANSDFDLFSSLGSSQPSKPSHQFQQRAAPAASPAPTFGETGDSWDSALVSLPTNQAAPAAPRNAKAATRVQPKPTSSATGDDLFFDVPSTTTKQQPAQTATADLDPFADLFNK